VHCTCRQADVVSHGVRRDEQGDPDYHFDADADPDPTLQFDADPDPQHWLGNSCPVGTVGTCRQAEVVSAGVWRDEKEDPDYHFDIDADSDPTLKFDADPDPQQ
jgi:hypothetical protein